MQEKKKKRKNNVAAGSACMMDKFNFRLTVCVCKEARRKEQLMKLWVIMKSADWWDSLSDIKLNIKIRYQD